MPLLLIAASPAYATGAGIEFMVYGFLGITFLGALLLYLLAGAAFTKPKTPAERRGKWDTIFVLLLGLALVAAVFYKQHLLAGMLEGLFALYLLARFTRLFLRRTSAAEPQLPPAPAPGAPKGFDHAEHRGLAVLTLGLWLPVWLLLWVVYKLRNKNA